MEKRKPSYLLAEVKALIRNGDYQVTRTALRCASGNFGFIEAAQVANAVLDIEETDFYKSMNTFCDAALWQDVYRPTIGATPAYVKVQIVYATTVVISFKALEDD